MISVQRDMTLRLIHERSFLSASWDRLIPFESAGSPSPGSYFEASIIKSLSSFGRLNTLFESGFCVPHKGQVTRGFSGIEAITRFVRSKSLNFTKSDLMLRKYKMEITDNKIRPLETAAIINRFLSLTVSVADRPTKNSPIFVPP